MIYDDKTIEQVQSLNDIVEVVSSYIPLKRAGRTFKACCPFHQEKTPSFIVNAERQIFHCFGCGEGGDVISFVMKYEQLSFPEALKLLARRVHVELPETGFQRQERSKADLLYQMYDAAHTFYHTLFLKSAESERARQYWKGRGFGEKEAVQFGVGYAPEGWRRLFEYLLQKGFQEDLLFRSGLIAKSAQGKPYDWFRNRLMFSIRNTQGRVIAFGGRVLTDETPKYLNSPETEIFKKRREFYGLHLAKSGLTSVQAEVRQMMVVEGYLDCIQLQANGFLNTVATLGTALTDEHVRVLRRYVDEAIVVYDGDKAGEQAAIRGLDVFLEEGMSARAISLPSGLDPDDFVRSKGKDAFREQMNQALDVFDFKLKILLGRFNKSDSSGLLKITSELLDTLIKIKNQVLLDRYLRKMSATLGVEERSLRVELEKLRTKRLSQRAGEESPARLASAALPEPSHEKMVLGCFLQDPSFYSEFKQALPGYQFEGERSRDLFQVLDEYLSGEGGSEWSAVRLLNQIRDERLKAFASELLAAEFPEGETRDKLFFDCLRKMENLMIERSLKEIQSRIHLAEQEGDQGLVTSLMQEYKELMEVSRVKKYKP